MALVTDKFRIYAAEAFRNTLGSSGSDANKVYLFVGQLKHGVHLIPLQLTNRLIVLHIIV